MKNKAETQLGELSSLIVDTLKSHAPMTRKGLYDILVHKHERLGQLATSTALNTLSARLNGMEDTGQACRAGVDPESGAILWTHPDNLVTASEAPSAEEGQLAEAPLGGDCDLIAEQGISLLEEAMEEIVAEPVRNDSDAIEETAEEIEDELEKLLAEPIYADCRYDTTYTLDPDDPIDRALLDIRGYIRDAGHGNVTDALHDPKSTLDALDRAIQLLRVVDMDKAARVEEVWDFINAETGLQASPQLDMWERSAS